MTAIRQHIESLGLNRRCRNFCLMCDLGYQDRFDKSDSETRKSYVESLAACTADEFCNNKPALGLITLLNETEFEEFIARLSTRAPFDASLAWNIIHLSSHGLGSWFIERGKAKFQRCFHLHPAIAPLLIQSAIRLDRETDDIIALFDCYESVAEEYPTLRDALPLWHAELKRREHERLEREEKSNAEILRQAAEKAEWTRKMNAITYGGPSAILNTLADATEMKVWRFPAHWADITNSKLRTLPSDLLAKALASVCVHVEIRCWRRLAHNLQSALHTQKRAQELRQLNDLPMIERLHAACSSRWSLTYYPLEWAEELLTSNLDLPRELKLKVLSKLKRLSHSGSWRSVRRYLLRE